MPIEMEVPTKLNLAFGLLHPVLYTPSAPSHGKAKKWVRNRNVWVVILPKDVLSPTCIRDPRIVESYLVAREVDSRYTGPNSKYGQAIKKAEAIIAGGI